MNLILIFLLPLIGAGIAFLINLFVKNHKNSSFKGLDILPFFFLVTVQLITNYKGRPSFLPYGFLYYFIFVIIYSTAVVVRNLNISLFDTLVKLWRYLAIISVIWVVILFPLVFL